MKKKSFSLQKLPQISKQKKQKLNEKNLHFEQKLKNIERLEMHNEMMSLKLKPYETTRSFKRQHEFKSEQRVHRVIKILTKHQKFVQLEPIRQVEYQSNKKIMSSTIAFKTPSKKMDVDGFLKQKNDRLIEVELKQVEIQNNRRQYLPSIVQSQKKTFPYYTQSTKKYQEQPFIKLQEKQEKMKIRFLNGFQKWISKANLKQVHQYEALTLQTYRKTVKNIKSNEISLFDLPQNKEIIEKINIDSAFLNKMLNQVYNKKNPRQQIKILLKEELYYNYEESVKQFNKMFVERRQVKRINRFQRKNKVSDGLKAFIDHHLVCSYNLQFLDQYMLSKTHYISTMVQSYNIIGKLERFQHFSKLYIINNTPKFVGEIFLSTQIIKYFKQQKDKIENVIYSLQQHLNVLVKILHKDIEHIIFLNPRLVGSNYEKDVKLFIASFSGHLSRIIRSVLINAINLQLQSLVTFYREYSVIKRHSFLVNTEKTKFYSQISGIYEPILSQFIKQKITHGPGLIPIVFSLKKWKRKRYNNIYKFIIQSRKSIRNFNAQQWSSFKGQDERIVFKDPLELLQSIIIKPLSQYLKIINDSQNVNGCIYNKKIELVDFINLDGFKKEMIKLYTKQRDEKVKMYATYFELWQLYFMQKPYIDDFIHLYKSIKAIKLIEQEMKYLKSDLELIRSLPKIIEMHFIRLDITQIKEKIEATIITFMKKILKTCEETLGKMLQYGYEQTIKAKKLNQVTPYTNLAEYIDFINFLNQRQVEKSIQMIAENVVFIDLNMSFLQKNHYQIKFSLIQRYLQSGTWIKKIRAAATQNKQKTVVDPFMFLKGVKDKRSKIFVKYNKILKEIIQLMKVNELKNATKLSVLAKNIAHEMKQICSAADDIVKEETLLELQYGPQDPANIDEDRFYRTDLTFFYKEERFLKKYLQFWTYAAKLRSVVDNVYDRRILDIDGVQFVRLLREGQQLISSIKISTLNKRFLHLCDEVMHLIEPFLKCSKLFLFLTIGAQSYRVTVIKQLTCQSSSEEMKVDPYNLSIKQLMALPLMSLDWHSIYKIKQDQENYEACRLKLSSIYLIIKNLQINIKQLKGIGNMREFEVIVVDDQTISILKQCMQTIKITEQKYGNLFKNRQNQDDLLGEAAKKINIFFKSILKIKSVSQKLIKYYPLFQLVYPLVYTAFEELNLSPYFVAYENVIVDMSKKADLAKKLTFVTFYDDKVRISFDEDLKKLQQFQIKFYKEMIDRFHNNNFYGCSSIQKQLIFHALSTLGTEHFNKMACKLMGEWCLSIKLGLDYDYDYYIILQEFETIYKQKIKVNRRQKLFQVRKFIEHQAQKVQIKCGLLILAQEINKQLQKKIQQQTFQILRLIYQYHYNIKNIFHFYLYINNLYLQSIINALRLTFHMDLELLYENKYDLNLLLTTIQQNKNYNPKEKDNNFITDALIRLEEQFLAIINVLQQKQYCLEDVQKGRIKKIYTYHSIPRLVIQSFNIQENRLWLDEVKQEKEDDFINNMHLSPSLNRLNLLKLDISKVQIKQIQKKETISKFEEDLNISHMIISSNTSKHDNKHKADRLKVKIIANIAPQFHLQDISNNFKFQIVDKCSTSHYIFDSFRATQLLLEALHSQKILITNIHPNYQLLGRNFLKISKFIPNYMKNMVIVVHSAKEVLVCLKSIVSYERNKANKLIYIYYDKLSHQQIHTEQVDQHCIVFQAQGKLHLNNLLKKQLNYNQRQFFNNFIETQSHFQSCIPFIDGSQKIISSNLLKFSLDGKQKQLLTGLIYSYENHHGLSSEVTEQKILMMSQPIYAITDSHYLINYYFDLGEFIYTKILKIASNDMNKQIMNGLVNTLLQPEQHVFAAYVLPIYDFAHDELFTTIQYQSFDQKTQDRYDKELFHIKTIYKPYFKIGIIHELIAFLSGKQQLSQKWNQFRLKGFEDASVKWFIIDISQQTSICNEIFEFFMQSFSNNEYILEDGSHYRADFHYNQRFIKDHKHKIIFIIHPNHLNQYKKDYPPIPIINESLKFDPLRQFKIFITSLSEQFPLDFMSLIRIPDLLDTFRQILGCITLEALSIQSMEIFKDIFFIMINEVRKREIALGHYNESSLTIEQSKQNFYGSIDLRQRNKLQQEMLVELQQIQKKMDLTRRQIHKIYTQNLKYQQLLTKKVYDRLQSQFNILNPTSYNKQEINDILKSSLIFSLYYSLNLASPMKNIEMSKSLQAFTNRPQLFNYCFSIQANKWERWQEIDTDLTLQSCTSSTSSKILHPKEILRHNLSKFKLQTLRDFIQDVDVLHNQLPPLISIKGPQIFFMKLFLLYKFPFNLTLPLDSYPTWLYEYQLSLLKKSMIINEPLRRLSESKNKKIAKPLLGIRLKDMVIKQVKIKDMSSLISWKSALNFKIIRNAQQWYSFQNTSIYFISKQSTNICLSSKIKLLKSHIHVHAEKQQKNQYKIFTMIYNINRFQIIQSQLDNAILSLKTYQNKFQFLQHFKFRQYMLKGLTNQQLQDMYGLKLVVTHPEKYSECRKKVKDIVSKIKMQQNQNKQELLPDQIQKLMNFDRISEINQVFTKMISAVQIKRSEISKNYIIRYLLKRPRKYERIQSPQVAVAKKRIKSPIKIQFDDVLYYDESYDDSNILLKEVSPIVLFFNLNERLLLVQNKGSYDRKIIDKYILGYKIYRKAIQIMLINKNTKPFTVDITQMDNYEVNLKEIELYDTDQLQIIKQELREDVKDKIRIVIIYNMAIIDKLLQIFTQNLIENVLTPKNHYYILFTPQLHLTYNHGLRKITQDSLSNLNYLTNLRQQKIRRLVAKIQQFTKKQSLSQLQKCNIGLNYIPAAVQKIIDIKIHTSNVKNDLLSKKEVYDKVSQDITSAVKSIQQCKNGIEENQKNIKEMQSSLVFWKMKKDFYIGNEQFKQANRQIREYQRKRLQKQLNRPQYIQDNSYNISYIYTFNILADNNYFPDKTLPLLDQQYQLNKNYQIVEDQKKLFQKHFNYGRLSAIIDNDELVFGDGLIQEDHLIMSNKLRNMFVYLRHVHQQIMQEKKYDKQSAFSLQVILKDQLNNIQKRKGNDCQQIFNRYIAFLATHKYIKYITANTIEKTEQQLKKARESILKMKEKIQHQQLKFSSNTTYLQQIKSKYEITQRELDTCKKNQELFIQETNQNILLISSLFFKQLIGINIQYQFYFTNRIFNEQAKKKEGANDKQKKRRNAEEDLKVQLKPQGTIKQISNKEVLISLAEYITDGMISSTRRPLNEKQKQFLISILPKQAIQELITTNHIQTVHELYENCIVYLVRQLFPSQSEIYQEKDISKIYPKLDYRKYNIVSLKGIYRSNTHYFCKQIESNYKFQIKGLVNRIANKKNILNNTLLKFSQKITLVQAKSSESILRFLLQNQTIVSIEQYLLSSFKAITNTPTENMYYDGQWIAKNQQKWQYYSSILQKVKQILKMLYKDTYNDHLELYYIRIIGMLGKRIPLSNLDSIIHQIHYDHSLIKNNSSKQIRQNLLQRRYQKKLNQQNQNDDNTTEKEKIFPFSYISTLDSLLATSMSLILVHGTSLLPKILLVKALRTNKILKKKYELEYYVEENKSKQYWILITINHTSNIADLLQKIYSLKHFLSLSDENHMKFILYFESNAWKKHELTSIQLNIQPIYRFFYKNSPMSIYYHCSFIFQQFSQRTMTAEIMTILNIANYYCRNNSHIPLTHIPLSNLEKNNLIQLLENIFDQYDYSSQSLYFRIVSSLTSNFQVISQTVSEKLAQIDRQATIQYFPFWDHESQLQQMIKQSSIIEQNDEYHALLYKWMMRIKTQIGKENYLKKDKMVNISFSQLMKPKRDEMGFLLHEIENALSNPYKFIIINNCFAKMIDKTITKRNKANNPMYNQAIQSQDNKQSKKQIHQLVEITNKNELFLQILHGSHTYGLRLNNITVQISQKDVSGSIGVFFKIIGAADEWLQVIFNGQLFMSVSDKKHKNSNELNFIKGVYFRYSEPIIYVKKQVQFGEEDNNVLRPLPQFKNLLPVYTSNNQYIGIIELTTNQPFLITPTLMIKLIA